MKELRHTLSVVAIVVLATSCQKTQQDPAQMSYVNEEGRTVLYNGIVLPEEWPPRYDIPTAQRAMPLPYVENRPDPIVINVGRQLFVDDFLIENTTLQRVNHHTNLYPGNPIVADSDTYSDGVWYDELEGKFKMWYRSYRKGEEIEGYTCYMESDDGYHWHRPKLDFLPGTHCVNAMHGDSHVIWLDKEEKDPSRRYKSFATDGTPDRSCNMHYIMQTSADGIHWSGVLAQSGRIQDRSTIFYNAFLKKWVMSARCVVFGTRSRAYSEHPDPETLVNRAHDLNMNVYDPYEVFWFCSDEQDPRHPNPKYAESYTPSLYNFDANAYESLLFGEYSASRGPENYICGRDGIWKLNEVVVGFSRDGFHLARPDHTAFIFCDNDNPDAWNGANMQPAAGNPLIVGDSLFFYTGGFPKYPVRRGATGLATLRRDGFVSMDAKGQEGTLTTPNVTFDGKYFFVNAEAKNLAVEVLDADGNVIKGFAKDDCVAMKDTNSTKYHITWNGKKHLGKLRNQKIKFRFYLTDGSLYAFWVSPWETGESRGYTGGGGPGLHPCGRDIPVEK